jgi:hypothetical protein
MDLESHSIGAAGEKMSNPEKEISLDNESHGFTEVIDHEAERALVRKLDWNVIPLIMVLYLFSFLDRGT